MNTQTTVEKLKALRLPAMSALYHRTTQEKSKLQYTADELLAILVDTEWEARHNRKITQLIKNANFSFHPSANDIDYTSHRNLDKNNLQRLLALGFIEQAENIIITGPTGVGKSYLAQAIGVEACTMNKKTSYYNWLTFSEQVKMAKLDGTYLKIIQKIQKSDLLIIDDFGLHPFDNFTRQALMDIVEAKYNKSSIIISSQIPVAQWHDLIGEGTIADAILDRLIHASHRIELQGESLRKNRTLKG